MYSVIIPAFNEEASIVDIIKRLREVYQKSEIIIVDDNSDDETFQKADQLGVVVLKNRRNLGPSKSIEKGIEHSSGDIIVTIDADGELYPEDLPRMIKPILENRVDFIIGRREELPRFSEKICSLIFGKAMGIHDPFCGYRVFTKRIYNKIGYFDRKDTFGLEFLINAHKRGFRLNETKIRTMIREGMPRLGGNIASNLKVFAAMTRGIQYLLVGR